MRRLWLALPLMLATLACEGDGGLTSADIVDDTPWTVPESHTYRVLDDDDEEVGTVQLSVEAEGTDALKFSQSFDFPERGFINEAVVIADATELQPSSAAFRIEGPEGDLDCDATYEGSRVSVHRIGEDGERDDEISVPDIAYDSWSDLFLWRTIKFTPGYEIEYTDILTCTLDRTQKLGVKLSLKDTEEVIVPAGTFEAWRLEIDSGGRTQKAWFTTDDAHTLVKYDNGRETFELLPQANHRATATFRNSNDLVY